MTLLVGLANWPKFNQVVGGPGTTNIEQLRLPTGIELAQFA
jgi:hypothetical protein